MKQTFKQTTMPKHSIRAFKGYFPVPDAAGMEEFRQLIFFLKHYEFNTVILETGGCIEYRKHPEINEKWLEYSHFMNEYPGKPDELRATFPWPKNSIHTANGGGKIVPLSMIREMLSLCAENGIEVIPEVPSLSHCDYIVAAHPELAERKEDPYPDTACPNHPEYHKLLFELLDETIEIFHPRIIHIGHDEYYSIGLCPRCQGKKPEEIYAEDVKACHDFLKSRGVETMMWGDKLLNAHFPNGDGCGGAEKRDKEGKVIVPATYKCIDLIPNDVILMHWYWSLDRHIEDAYDARGFRYIFANLSLRNIPEWKRRSEKSNVLGVCISNWGELNDRTLRRNAIYFDIASQSFCEWNSGNPEEHYDSLRDQTLADLYEYGKAKKGGDLMELTHTCTMRQEYKLFFDGWFVTEEKDLLGWHVFRDEDGKEYRLEVVYGKNISSDDMTFQREMMEFVGENYDTFRCDMRLFEPSEETLPFRKDGRTWYRFAFKNPAPGKRLTYDRFVPAKEFGGTVEVLSN